MDTYFLGILDYEQKKADAGLFMSDEACLKVIEGCEVFTEHPDDNFLIDTFSNRLNAMDGLTDTQKNAYLKQHSKVLSDHGHSGLQPDDQRTYHAARTGT